MRNFDTNNANKYYGVKLEIINSNTLYNVKYKYKPNKKLIINMSYNLLYGVLLALNVISILSLAGVNI